ncbi:hypothetical protein RSAG8_12178, partial [Rhizoctonia solani AG-8 WAC10335]
MSDLSNPPPPEAASAGTKRKSTAGASASKRAKTTQSDPFANTKNAIQTILASPETFSLPGGDSEYRQLVVSIAQYAKSLEGSIAVAGSSTKAAPPPKTPEQVSAEAERITDQINRGISKLMTVSNLHYREHLFFAPNEPRWNFKTKKYTKEEFEDLVGSVSKDVRYDTLYLTGPVNLRYNPDTGEFKFSGSYGKTVYSGTLSSNRSCNTTSGRKRKSTGSGATQATKKPRGRGKKSQPDPYEMAKGYVESVLAAPESFDLPEDDEGIREMFATIVRYTKSLEGSVAVAGQTGRDAPPPKTPEQIQAEVLRITNLINRGIKKLMTWKPNCKYGRARYAFDGVCADPRVFGAVFGLGGPPTWRAKKYTYADFETSIGEVEGRARYSQLVLTSDVNVRYNPETGEFKVSGSYGDSQWRYSQQQSMRTSANVGGGLFDQEDSDLSSPTPAASTSRKRKSSGTDSAPAPKKPRGRKAKVDPYATAKGHVDAILGSTVPFRLPENPQDILDMLKAIA